jgi:DNA-binding transcriptional LysR family regulator
MRINQLDGYLAFVTVARTRSFTAAAALLEVSPQAVSQAVKVLEDRLQLRLLHRTTRSVSVNEAGERFLARVGPALTDLMEAAESLQDLRDKPSGQLRVNLPRAAFTALIRPRIADFHRLYPDVRLEFGFDDRFVDIVEQGFDAGIRLGEAVAQDMVSVPLSREERIAIVATPGYLKKHGTPTTIADLAAHTCVRFRMPASGIVYRWELIEAKRSLEVEVNGPITVNDTDALLAMALDGIGLAYVLECTARPFLASKRLRKVLEKCSPKFPGFHLYYPSRRQLPGKLRCFVDFWRA